MSVSRGPGAFPAVALGFESSREPECRDLLAEARGQERPQVRAKRRASLRYANFESYGYALQPR